MKYLILMAGFLAACSPVLAQNLTIDGQVGAVAYTSEGPKEVEAITRGFEVPKGMVLVQVNHADRIVCTTYPVEPTWTLKALYRPVVKPKGLTAAQVTKLKEVLK